MGVFNKKNFFEANMTKFGECIIPFSQRHPLLGAFRWLAINYLFHGCGRTTIVTNTQFNWTSSQVLILRNYLLAHVRMFRQISRRVVGDGNGTSFASADWLSVMQDDWVTCLPGFRTRSNHAWLMNLRLRARTSASDAISWMDRKVAHRRNAAPRQNSHATLPRIFVKAPRIVVAWSLPHFAMTPGVTQSKPSPRVVSISGMHRVTYASGKELMQNTPGSFFFEI